MFWLAALHGGPSLHLYDLVQMRIVAVSEPGAESLIHSQAGLVSALGQLATTGEPFQIVHLSDSGVK